MKCVKKGDKVMKVPEQRAAELVKQGWVYCPKSEWKKTSTKEVIEKPVAVKREGPKAPRKRKNKEEVEKKETT